MDVLEESLCIAMSKEKCSLLPKARHTNTRTRYPAPNGLLTPLRIDFGVLHRGNGSYSNRFVPFLMGYRNTKNQIKNE